jgi:Ni/Co efflux regulator RcnB
MRRRPPECWRRVAGGDHCSLDPSSSRMNRCYHAPEAVQESGRMKRILVVVTTIGLLLPGLALAQSDQREHQGGRGEAAPANRPASPAQERRPGPPGPPHQAQAMPARPPAARPPAGRPPQAYERPPQAYGRPPQAYGRPVVAQPLPPRGNQFWHRGRYYGRIHGPAFVYPRGWAYRRWTIGARLPPVLFAPAYFYPGWAALGLGAAPPGYAWVRYGPDLLEVNLTSGEVEDVVYGVFY